MEKLKELKLEKFMSFLDTKSIDLLHAKSFSIKHLKADKVWTDMEEFENSQEMADLWEGFQRSKTTLKHSEFRMAFKVGKALYKVYKIKGMYHMRKITIHSMISNAGFGLAMVREDGFTIMYPENGTKSYSQCSKGREFFKRNNHVAFH